MEFIHNLIKHSPFTSKFVVTIQQQFNNHILLLRWIHECNDFRPTLVPSRCHPRNCVATAIADLRRLWPKEEFLIQRFLKRKQ
jgi:hypothetical protein